MIVIRSSPFVTDWELEDRRKDGLEADGVLRDD